MTAYTPEIVASTATTAGILTAGAVRAVYTQTSQAVENLAERLMQKQTSQDRAKSSCTQGYICSTGSKRQDLHTTPPATGVKEATRTGSKLFPASQHELFLRGVIFLYRIQALFRDFLLFIRARGLLPTSKPLKTAQNSPKTAQNRGIFAGRTVKNLYKTTILQAN